MKQKLGSTYFNDHADEHGVCAQIKAAAQTPMAV